MNNRELIERTKVITERGWFYNDKPISENEIIKPYLEKLYEGIINRKWGASNDDFMAGVAAVSNMIYDIIEMMGKEQE